MTTRARIAGGDAGSPAWALADIDGQLYKREVDAGHETWAPVAAVAEADGLSFLCPACLDAHGDDDVGTHSVMCWFVGRVPDDVSPKPGRWTPAVAYRPGGPGRGIPTRRVRRGRASVIKLALIT